MSRRALPIGLSCLISAMAQAQTWRSGLYPQNWESPDESVSFYDEKLIQDFSFAGYKRGEESVPDVAGPVFDVTDFGADPTGATDSTAAIQDAIDSAALAGGGVVYLPAGEFRVSPQGSDNFCIRIQTSRIVLRGAGEAETFLLNTWHTMNGKTILQVSPASAPSGNAQAITADLPGPTRRIPVASPGSFSPGGFVRLEWEFTDGWIAEHNQQTWWNATNGRPSNARYLREVIATNPGEGWIEVDVPTRYSVKTRDNPRVIPIGGLLAEVGVESLSLGNLQHPGSQWGENDYTDPAKAAYDAHNSWLIRVQNARDCWITGVSSRQAAANTTTCHMLSNGISLSGCFRITVRDCRMRRPQYGGGGGNGYMYRIQQSNECLLESCTADFSRHGFVISHAGTSGNVFTLCEDRETARATGASASGYTTSGSGSDNHMHFSHSNLWDCCLAHNSFYTAHHRTTSGSTPHGLTSAHSVYWNTGGSGTRYNDIVRSEQGRYGYVIGTSGAKSGATNPTGGNTAPADHLEGIGLGATLEPQSLYLDQLDRRTRPTLALSGESVRFPDNTFTVGADITVGGQPIGETVGLEWSVISTPLHARLVSGDTAEGRSFTVSHPGTYTIGASGSYEGQVFSRSISVEVLATHAPGGVLDLLPLADSHVQGGSATESLNYGASSTLQIKDSGAVHVHREAFMRFDLSGVPAESILGAALHMYFTSTDTEGRGRTSVVSDNTWGEMAINYLNRPVAQAAVVGDWLAPAQAWLSLDVGNVVPTQVAGNGLISFRHQMTSQPSAPVYAFASRENATVANRPFLRLQLAPPTFGEWLAEATDLKSGDRDPDDDPDGDGTVNLLEVLLGTDASAPNASESPQVARQGDGVELSLRMNASPPAGLIYFVERSGTLAADDWQLVPGAVWEAGGPEQEGRIPMVVRIPGEQAATKGFFRISASMQ